MKQDSYNNYFTHSSEDSLLENSSYWKALGLKALTLPTWDWMVGMLWLHDATDYWGRVYEDADHPHEGFRRIILPVDKAWPDFRDPATRGCLLELARRASGKPNLVTVLDEEGGFWWVGVARIDKRPEVTQGLYTTEAEALLAALEFPIVSPS